jgi:uncharacterized protein YPO0396
MDKIASEGLKSIRLEIENFKNIDKKIIDIGGRSLLFMGRNGSGKSTLIQAMMSPMNSKLIPTEPVKKGETRAKISHTIGGNIHGEYREYTMDIYFTDKDKKGRLVVYNEKGEQIKSPATMIKSIIGDVSFDVMKWLNDDKPKKLNTLKKLTGCHVEIDTITNKISTAKEELKMDKKRAEDLEAILKNHGYSKDEIDAYSSPIDIKPLQEQMSLIAKAQSDYDGVASKVEMFKKENELSAKKIEAASIEISRLQALIKQAQESINVEVASVDANNEKIAKGETWMTQVQRPSVDDLNNKINQAIAHNEKCNNVSRLAEHQSEMLKLKDKIETTKSTVEKMEFQRSEIINKSQLPIEGLSFSEDDIFLNGIPLEEGQVNTAKLFDVGVEVAMALNPNLKIIFLHDGSLFDRESLHTIVEKIEKKGYMAVVEVVDFDGGDLEVKFTEKELK